MIFVENVAFTGAGGKKYSEITRLKIESRII